MTRTTLRTIVYTLLFVPSLLVVMALLHEAGHALAAQSTGHYNAQVYVWPGREVYPDFGARYPRGWPQREIAITNVVPAVLSRQSQRLLEDLLDPANILQLPRRGTGRPMLVGKATVAWWGHSIPAVADYLAPTRIHFATAMLMGSGLTLLLSIAGTVALLWLKPAGLLLHVTRIAALLHLDILAYTLFPYFFGLRHLVFWGGRNAEPVVALSMLGIPASTSIPVIVLVSLTLILLYLSSLRRSAPPDMNWKLRLLPSLARG